MFKTRYWEGYNPSKASENTNNGAFVNPYKIYVNYRNNWEFYNGDGSGTMLDDLFMQQRMQLGMTADSWCMIKLPRYFKPSPASKVSLAQGNLTSVTSWEIPIGDEYFDNEVFYLTYHAGEDLWPMHTNNFQLTEVLAPYGEQKEYTMPIDFERNSEGFRGQMFCGNMGDDGESGETYDALHIVPMWTGYDSGSLNNKNTKQKTIQDFAFTFKLDDNYPIGEACVVSVEWLSSSFIPSVILLDKNQYIADLDEGISAVNFTVAEHIPTTRDLKITFKDTYVNAEVSSDSDSVVKDFLSKVNVIGNWVLYGGQTGNGDSEGHVYRCEGLDAEDGTENCG